MPRFLSALSESRRYYYQRSRRSINDSRDRMHFVFNNVCTARSSLSLSLSLSLCTIVTLFVQRDRHIQTSKTKLKRRVESSHSQKLFQSFPSASLPFAVFSLPFFSALFLRLAARDRAPLLCRAVFFLLFPLFFFVFFQSCDFYAITFPHVIHVLAKLSYFFGI